MHQIKSRRLLPATVLALIILALLPTRAARWMDWFGDLTIRIIAPISHPTTQLARWLSPARVAQVENKANEQLQREAEYFDVLYRQALQENERLRILIRELQGGMEIPGRLPWRPYTAAVTGHSADLSSGLLTVRAGTKQGVVERNTVAVVRAVDLVGRIAHVSTRLSRLRLINDHASGRIEGRVIVDESGTTLKCSLEPLRDGTLQGVVAVSASLGSEGDPPQARKGMLVRLDDASWPASAQQLIIGVIQSVTPAPDVATRQVIIVKPRVELPRVAEVILRITDEAPIDDEEDTP